MTSGDPALERAVRGLLVPGERLDFWAEANLGPHPLASQMLYSLTMGGPRPRTEKQFAEAAHGVLVMTDRRLFVLAHGRVAREVRRERIRVTATGGTPLMPWADVEWGGTAVRVGFHWGRSSRDRMVALLHDPRPHP